jgi:hypothetical protein
MPHCGFVSPPHGVSATPTPMSFPTFGVLSIRKRLNLTIPSEDTHRASADRYGASYDTLFLCMHWAVTLR